MTVNERIKEIRKSLDLTLDKFGERIGVKKAAVSRWENGDKIADRMILSICREFNVNEDWLRNGTGEMFLQRDKLQIISEFAADMVKEPNSFKSRLFEAMAKLDENDWIAIEQIFDKISSKKMD